MRRDSDGARIVRPVAGLRAASLVLLTLGLLAPEASAGLTLFQGTSTTPAGLVAVRDSFRAAIGGGVVAAPNGSFGGVRREINWDAVPDARADPNLLPANFFNANSPRGVVFSTAGTGFLVSANPGGSTPIGFGFSSDFVPFSNNRMFTPIGSNVFNVDFFVPGTNQAAGVHAFGAVFNDVEFADFTKLEFFGPKGNLLLSQSVLTNASGGLSFLGVQATAGEVITRVRFTLGDAVLTSNGNFASGNDGVVTDDFLYAEPFAVPEPATLGLMALGLAGLAFARSRRGA